VFVPPNATRSVGGGVMITIFSRNSRRNAKWLSASCQVEEGTEHVSSENSSAKPFARCDERYDTEQGGKTLLLAADFENTGARCIRQTSD
jgi:hypothetical protein